MKNPMTKNTLALGIVIAALVACSKESPKGDDKRDDSQTPQGPAVDAPSAADVNPRLLRRFAPMKVPASADPPAVVELGRALFHDARLSSTSDVACSTCHDLEMYGVDRRPTSVGIGKQVGERNAPTVINAATQFAQFWDGRAGSAEEQATGPILNPSEMGMASPAAVMARLRSIRGYAPMFRAAFPNDADPLTLDNVGRAVASFERRLMTPSRWDKYLEGDQKALTPAEKEGLRTFLNVGCMVCHTGPLLGGSMFERVGVVEPWPNQKDIGRAKITGSSADRMMFKVPTLRNITETSPYFHDGSGDTLPNAIRMMGRHQLGVELTGGEVDAITTWMGSLRGDLPVELVRRPKLPE
jgi:cytochrome c peroxidase